MFLYLPEIVYSNFIYNISDKNKFNSSEFKHQLNLLYNRNNNNTYNFNNVVNDINLLNCFDSFYSKKIYKTKQYNSIDTNKYNLYICKNLLNNFVDLEEELNNFYYDMNKTTNNEKDLNFGNIDSHKIIDKCTSVMSNKKKDNTYYNKYLLKNNILRCCIDEELILLKKAKNLFEFKLNNLKVNNYLERKSNSIFNNNENNNSYESIKNKYSKLLSNSNSNF